MSEPTPPPEAASFILHLSSFPSVSVVVLSYNSARFMRGCLDALARSRGVNLEIICVDNASADESHEIASSHQAVAKALRSNRNLGFSGGNNLGLREATAPFVVLLNPDCWVQPDAVANLVAPLVRDASIGAVGALLYYPSSHRIQHAGGILHPNAMCEHFGMGELDDGTTHRTSREVQYVTGAFIAFRREELLSLGGLDEEYWPAYYEETDLCAQLKRRGKRVWYEAAAVGYHYESPGLARASARFVRTSYRSRIRYLIKNYTLRQWFLDFLPFEAKWFLGPFAKGFRVAAVRSYAEGALFAAKCLLRCSRRRRS